MNTTKHGVLTATELVWSANKKIQTVQIGLTVRSIGDIHDLALTHELTHVWVYPGTLVDMAVSEPYSIFCSYADSDTYDDDGKLVAVGEKIKPMFARTYKKGTYGEVKIGFPDNGRWGWEIDTPVTILATIHYLEQVLGIPVEWSPGHMGTELVKLLNKTAKRQDWTRESTINLKELPFNVAARDLLWKAADMWELQEGWYVHQFDKRSGYLSACPGLYVGAGDPVHSEKISDPSLPGIYRVTVEQVDSSFDNKILPAIINTEWVTSDVLTYAVSQGYEITIHEGWQFQEKHQVLRSYAEKLWNSRRVFRDDLSRFPHKLGRENAEITMKEIALISTGKFAYKKATRFLRPDWWASVVGKMRTNILRNLYTFHKQGFTPVLIYSDSVYFASPDANPATAIPGILAREKELGGYKHEGTWLVDAEMIKTFQTEKPGKVQGYLELTPKIQEVLV